MASSLLTLAQRFTLMSFYSKILSIRCVLTHLWPWSKRQSPQTTNLNFKNQTGSQKSQSKPIWVQQVALKQKLKRKLAKLGFKQTRVTLRDRTNTCPLKLTSLEKAQGTKGPSSSGAQSLASMLLSKRSSCLSFVMQPNRSWHLVPARIQILTHRRVTSQRSELKDRATTTSSRRSASPTILT